MFKKALGQAVTECMGSGLSSFKVNTRFQKTFMNQCPDCTGIKFCIWWFYSYKYMVRIRLRSGIFKIVDDSFTDIG